MSTHNIYFYEELKIITVMILSFQTEWQTVQTHIRLLLEDAVLSVSTLFAITFEFGFGHITLQ